MGRRSNRADGSNTETRRSRDDRDGRGDDITGNAPFDDLLDRFSSTDELLANTNQTLEQIERDQAALADLMAQLNELLGADSDPERLRRTDRPVVSDAIVEPQEEATDEITVPRDGSLSNVRLSWPQGSAQTIGIGLVGVDGESLVPFGPSGAKYIALDNVTVPFELDYGVEKGQTLTVRYVNNRVASDPNDPAEVQALTAYPSAVLTFTEGF